MTALKMAADHGWQGFRRANRMTAFSGQSARVCVDIRKSIPPYLFNGTSDDAFIAPAMDVQTPEQRSKAVSVGIRQNGIL
jgi:hypothetical protein